VHHLHHAHLPCKLALFSFKITGLARSVEEVKTKYTFACGRFWAFFRCTWYRIVRKYTWYTAYSVAYQLKDFCCPGYKQVGSECKAICHRLCYNGGTCVGPDRCQCANGWSGQYCTMFWICSPKCENGGTCVRGLICQCADGWKGSSCTIPSGRNNS
jgi:hypothetical protein